MEPTEETRSCTRTDVEHGISFPSEAVHQQQQEPHQEEQQEQQPVLYQTSYLLTKPILRISVHILGLSAFMAIAIVAQLQTPVLRGFFCNDTEIAYPYKEIATVPTAELMYISIVFPALIIAATEMLFLIIKNTQPAAAATATDLTAATAATAAGKAGGKANKRGETAGKGWLVPSGLMDMYRHLGAFSFAHVSCWLLTDSIKKTVGSLRPHFLHVCQPDWDQIQCKGDRGEYMFVPDAHCKGDIVDIIDEARRSFPSGHSSQSMCGLLFAAVYLQSRYRYNQRRTMPMVISNHKKSVLRIIVENIYFIAHAAVPFMQISLILLALYVAGTRVHDHYHHVRDCCGGVLLGALTAMHAAFFVIDMRKG